MLTYAALRDLVAPVRLIVEKLQNSGVLGRDLAGNRLGSSATLRFELTTVSKRLKSYLDAVRPAFIEE